MRAKTKRLLIVAVFALLMVTLLAIVGCAPKVNTPVQGGGDTAGTTDIEWSMDVDCAICHTKEASSMTDTATASAAHENIACTTCHKDTDGKLTTVHSDISGKEPPTRAGVTRAYISQSCRCHRQDALVQATADSTVIEQFAGVQVNPHALPEAEAHQAIVCSSCHKLHDPLSGFDADIEKLCVGCHHDRIFDQPCSNCHEDE